MHVTQFFGNFTLYPYDNTITPTFYMSYLYYPCIFFSTISEVSYVHKVRSFLCA